MVERLERKPALVAEPETKESLEPPVEREQPTEGERALQVQIKPLPQPEPPVITTIQPEKPVTIYMAPSQSEAAPKPAPILPVVSEEKKPKPAPIPETTPASVHVVEGELNSRQKELLEKLKDLKKITRKEYAQLFKISVPTASRDLKELVDKKILQAQGPLGPGRWYELA